MAIIPPRARTGRTAVLCLLAIALPGLFGLVFAESVIPLALMVLAEWQSSCSMLSPFTAQRSEIEGLKKMYQKNYLRWATQKDPRNEI